MSLYLLDTFKFPIIGEVDFECSETEYQWQVPAGVTRISAILVGGGCGGGAGSNQTERPGGGGGACRWVNDLVVQPGEILSVKSGCGGTSVYSGQVLGVNRGIVWNRPGAHSYIASKNNSNVPERAGIGNTIIVIAEGGGWDDSYLPEILGENTRRVFELDSNREKVIPLNSVDVTDGSFALQASSPFSIGDTVGIGTSGGQGTAFGVYSWGTVGGGNGGVGGSGGGNGGGQDGGGGGSGGYIGIGGHGGQETNNSTNVKRILPRKGQGGAGGGGFFGKGGGGNSGGGGGGVGVFWGIGPSGEPGGYFSDGSTVEDLSPDTNVFSTGGQGGSWGADGRATGCQVDDYSVYQLTTTIQHSNNSNGDGRRGYRSDLDSADLEDRTDADRVKGDGGAYGGGGGGCDLSTGNVPRSGAGGPGHVRFVFKARIDTLIREYGGGRTTESRTIKGQNVTVKFYDYDSGLDVTSNIAAGWPSWFDPTNKTEPPSGEYYNHLVNWASNLPGDSSQGGNNKGYLPPGAGINTNPNNRTF
jgi:hypothetical protein